MIAYVQVELTRVLDVLTSLVNVIVIVNTIEIAEDSL
jgi:hypothetical protein